MSPVGIRTFASTLKMRKWSIARIDAKGVFLQTGTAHCDLYVIPAYDCIYRNFLWVLETAAYGLINLNAKWQHRSDAVFF